MTQVISEPPEDAHVAACGLFCSNCRAFKIKKCPGCQVGPRFARCSVRRCCVQQGITTCAACEEFKAPHDFRECKKLNNWIAKLFALVFGTDRPKALAMLRDRGRDAYLQEKRESGRM